MPKAWFFEIHEDTPEQEAANLMEHSAAVLDIRSDDDVETKKRNEEHERGKENSPPPDFAIAQPHSPSATTEEQATTDAGVKMPRLREVKQDAMDEDRKPLGDLPAAEFYGEGCDKDSYVTVDAGIQKPSSLSKECDFNDCATPEKPTEKPAPLPPWDEVGVRDGDAVRVYAAENVAPVISLSTPEPTVCEVL